ncbi:hypothetical protein [Acidicapsa ligni]|uniref:hypothetical protein n=1 Tax=Acidicapsa ligni TaxID=542300 RepID=UPI0021DF661D|nr:hypothetical protein [Acidicapsa ligni]
MRERVENTGPGRWWPKYPALWRPFKALRSRSDRFAALTAASATRSARRRNASSDDCGSNTRNADQSAYVESLDWTTWLLVADGTAGWKSQTG